MHVVVPDTNRPCREVLAAVAFKGSLQDGAQDTRPGLVPQAPQPRLVQTLVGDDHLTLVIGVEHLLRAQLDLGQVHESDGFVLRFDAPVEACLVRGSETHQQDDRVDTAPIPRNPDLAACSTPERKLR